MDYLSAFDKIKVDSAVGIQKPFDAPKMLVKEYSIMEDDAGFEAALVTVLAEKIFTRRKKHGRKSKGM